MSTRKRDWDVHTGWEKRIKVDFGSIGPNHVRWSDWTYKERDIVARKVHEARLVSDNHGPRSKRMEAWAKEHEPIMIGFARDRKPMPDWAHADHRESGIPEHVKVVWHQGDWAYSEKPFPEYEDPVAGPPTGTKPVDPAWSAVPGSGDAPEPVADTPEYFTVGDLRWHGLTVTKPGYMVLPITGIIYPDGNDELIGAVESKDASRGGWVGMRVLEAAGGSRQETIRDATEFHFKIPTSYSIEDYETAKFRLCFRKSNSTGAKMDFLFFERPVPIKGSPAMDPEPERRPKDMHDVQVEVPEPQKSFLSYAVESHHGHPHQLKWARVLLATGYAWEGYCSKSMENVFRDAERKGAMDYAECLKFYERHHRNARWTLAKKWFEDNGGASPEELKRQYEADRKRRRELEIYANAPPTQGNFSVEQWRARYGTDPEVVLVMGWGMKYIVDPQTREPLWGLDGDAPATGAWRYDDGEWVDLDAGDRVGDPNLGTLVVVEVDADLAEALAGGDWAAVARIAQERV